MQTFLTAHPADIWAPFASNNGKNGLSVTENGPSWPLGEKFRIGPRATDYRLYYTDSSGEVQEASKSNASVVQYEPASGDVEIKQYAGSGEQVWMLVYTAEAIAQGNPVTRKVSSLPSGFAVGSLVVEAADATDSPESVIGVAQHDIPSGRYAFVLCKGVGKALCDNGISVGQTLTVSPSNDGQVDHVATAATDAGFGIALEASSAGSFSLVYLNCPAG